MKSDIRPECKYGEFLPTLIFMIRETDSIIKNVPLHLRNSYAELFANTEIEKLLFSTANFEEQASEYCREAGWKEPS